MANYASLRGPVGMNRVFLKTAGELSPAALRAALTAGHSFASNGPLLGLELDGRQPGDVISRSGPGKLRYRISLRSPVAVDHLELVQNGKVVKAFALAGDRHDLDASGELQADAGGWVLLRAWNDGADPQVLDLYPYATTSPIYLELPGGLPPDPEDAAYFVAWLDRVIADASARSDFRTARERGAVLDYLRKAREHYEGLASAR
jgi:TolB protein